MPACVDLIFKICNSIYRLRLLGSAAGSLSVLGRLILKQATLYRMTISQSANQRPVVIFLTIAALVNLFYIRITGTTNDESNTTRLQAFAGNVSSKL